MTFFFTASTFHYVTLSMLSLHWLTKYKRDKAKITFSCFYFATPSYHSSLLSHYSLPSLLLSIHHGFLMLTWISPWTSQLAGRGSRQVLYVASLDI